MQDSQLFDHGTSIKKHTKKMGEFPDKYLDKNIFDALLERFNAFSSIENFSKLEEELMPKLNAFTDLITEMEKNH